MSLEFVELNGNTPGKREKQSKTKTVKRVFRKTAVVFLIFQMCIIFAVAQSPRKQGEPVTYLVKVNSYPKKIPVALGSLKGAGWKFFPDGKVRYSDETLRISSEFGENVTLVFNPRRSDGTVLSGGFEDRASKKETISTEQLGIEGEISLEELTALDLKLESNTLFGKIKDALNLYPFIAFPFLLLLGVSSAYWILNFFTKTKAKLKLEKERKADALIREKLLALNLDEKDTDLPMDLDGKYRFLKGSGAGGMATFYKAVKLDDISQQGIVGIKKIKKYKPKEDAVKDPTKAELAEKIQLNDTQEVKDRVLQEIRTMKKLKHDNIVKVIDFSDTDPVFIYIVLEYYEGQDLSDFSRAKMIKSRKGMSLKEVRKFFLELGGAIAFMHSKNVMHRDIKLENIVRKNDGTYVLIDFGLARDEENLVRITKEGVLEIGTPPYMALEHFEGKPTIQSDIFSFGVCLHELLAGFMPIRATEEQIQKSSLCRYNVSFFFFPTFFRSGENIETLRSLPDLPPTIARVLDKMMRSYQGDRYSTLQEAINDFEEAYKTLSEEEKERRFEIPEEAIEILQKIDQQRNG